jgi:hypothetical protein
MGDIVPIKPKIEARDARAEFLKYIEFHDKHHEMIEGLVATLCSKLRVNDTVIDIDAASDYDLVLMSESVMSMLMRTENIYHPLHDFIEQNKEFFGVEEAPPEPPPRAS